MGGGQKHVRCVGRGADRPQKSGRAGQDLARKETCSTPTPSCEERSKDLSQRPSGAIHSGAAVESLFGTVDNRRQIIPRRDASRCTADLLIENQHFDLRWTSLRDLGYKSLAVNLSDIAAMGGVADYVILSLGIPPRLDSADIDAFYRGFATLGRECSVGLVGGDTNAARELIISVCFIGHALARPVKRHGARSGGDIYVTGPLGG